MQEKELMIQMKKTYKLDPIQAIPNTTRIKKEDRPNSNELGTHNKRKRDKSSCRERKTELNQIDNPATSSDSIHYTANLKESSISEENKNDGEQDSNSKRKKKKKRKTSEQNIDCDKNLVHLTSNKKKKQKT